MIKFFRRIRQSLLSEGKFSKYIMYAVGEIVLVVIGILIALQINNWNEQRKENIYEQKLLNELKSDFSYNKKELLRNIKKSSKLVKNCDSLIALLSLPTENIDQIKFVHFTRRMTGYSTFDPSNGALNNLMSSGNLNIIKNDSLRMQLSRWFGVVQDVKEDEKRLIDFGDMQMEPFTFEYLTLNTNSKISPNNLVLLENRKFENMVINVRQSANYILRNYNALDLEIDRILEYIDSELVSF